MPETDDYPDDERADNVTDVTECLLVSGQGDD